MDSKEMKELNPDELQKVSGGNANGSKESEMRCMCGSTNVKVIFWWADGGKKIKCNDCSTETIIHGNSD